MRPIPTDETYPVEDFDYRLLDTGNLKKLERFGPYTFVRPAPQVIWPRICLKLTGIRPMESFVTTREKPLEAANGLSATQSPKKAGHSGFEILFSRSGQPHLGI